MGNLDDKIDSLVTQFLKRKTAGLDVVSFEDVEIGMKAYSERYIFEGRVVAKADNIYDLEDYVEKDYPGGNEIEIYESHFESGKPVPEHWVALKMPDGKNFYGVFPYSDKDYRIGYASVLCFQK